MKEKFCIKQNNILNLVNEMCGKLSSYTNSLQGIREAFDAFSSDSGFMGTSANSAKEYCSYNYGSMYSSSVPILMEEAAQAIIQSIFLWEKKYFDFDYEDNFVVNEEYIDEEIENISIKRSDELAIIQDKLQSTISSISDIMDFDIPNDSLYRDYAAIGIARLQKTKQNVYDIESMELKNIERLNDHLDSLLALVNSKTSKDRRISSFVSADQIICNELEEALEKYSESLSFRQLHHDDFIEAYCIHYDAMERRMIAQSDEARETQGALLTITGLFATSIGFLTVLASGGATLPIVVGGGSIIYGGSKIQEGCSEYHLSMLEDYETKAFNCVRDPYFMGNQKLYDFVGNTFVFSSAAILPLYGGPVNLETTSAITTSAIGLESRVIVYDMAVSNVAACGAKKICNYYKVPEPIALIAETGASILTSNAICKYVEYKFADTAVSTIDDIVVEDTLFHIDDANVEELNFIDNRPMGYYSDSSIFKNGTLNSDDYIIDYSNIFEKELDNFNGDFSVFTKTNQELILVQFSSDAENASLRYWTSVEQANSISTLDEYLDSLAISKYWGNRNVVKVARIPANTPVKYAYGTARAQLFIEDPRPGGGIQYLFNSFDKKWITEIRTYVK